MRRGSQTLCLGALLYGLVHSEIAGPAATSTPLVVVVFFVIIFLGGVFQASFGLVKVGTLLKYTPHPVVAGFQNTAAALLSLVQLANVSGFEQTKPFTFVLTHPAAIKPLSVLLAALTFGAMWNSLNRSSNSTTPDRSRRRNRDLSCAHRVRIAGVSRPNYRGCH